MQRLLAVFSFILAGLGVLLWLKVTRTYLPFGSDFAQDYLAGYALRHGRSIYQEIPLLAREVLGFANHGNFHPPFVALLFYPLSFLSYSQAAWAWNALSFSLFTTIIILTLRRFELSATPYALFTPLLYLWFPFVFCIGTIQISPLVSALIIFAWFAAEKNRDTLSGVCVALAALLKLFPALLIVWFLAKGRWRALGAFAITAAIASLAAILTIGSKDVLYYLTHVIQQNAAKWTQYPINDSLWGFWSSVFIGNGLSAPVINRSTYYLPIAVLCCGGILGGLFTVLKGQLADTFWSFMLTVLAMLLISPLTWLHIIPVLLPIWGWWLANVHRLTGLSKFIIPAAFVAFSLPDVLLSRALAEHYGVEQIPWSVSLVSRAGFFGLILLYGYAFRSARAQ